LSPAEVTLLEAVRYYDRGDPIPWDDAVATVRDGNVEQSLGHMGMLRADAIMWAAEGEHGEASVFHDRISEVCGALAPASAGTCSSSTTRSARALSTRPVGAF